jgi:hypothetical protein
MADKQVEPLENSKWQMLLRLSANDGRLKKARIPAYSRLFSLFPPFLNRWGWWHGRALNREFLKVFACGQGWSKPVKPLFLV